MIPDKIKRGSRAAAEVLRKMVHPEYGYIVLVFESGTAEEVVWFSNVPPENVAALLDEILAALLDEIRKNLTKGAAD